MADKKDTRPRSRPSYSKKQKRSNTSTTTRTIAGQASALNIHPAVLWFTGLSGSGKSTIAEKVVRELKKFGADIEYLDGDTMRGIFPNTGFTKDARNEHVRRVGYLAGMLEKHGVIVVASFISPYRKGRAEVRKLCRNFIEIHVSTPLAECERRDPKGLYRKARRGEIENFTGISDPYEAPKHPELTIDTTGMTVAEAVGVVLDYLKRKNG
jgi:adenylylsulfate kinase